MERESIVEQDSSESKYRHYKLAAVTAALVYCFYYLSTRAEWHFIDNVDLIIHEAGHIVFMFFGNTLYVAGGSLFQVIVPAVFLGYFLLKQHYYSATIMAYWMGLSIINVSVYAGDAVRMQLQLLTGDKDGHDWNQLLVHFGLLHHTLAVSNIILVCGVIVIIAGYLLALFAWNQES